MLVRDDTQFNGFNYCVVDDGDQAKISKINVLAHWLEACQKRGQMRRYIFCSISPRNLRYYGFYEFHDLLIIYLYLSE